MTVVVYVYLAGSVIGVCMYQIRFDLIHQPIVWHFSNRRLFLVLAQQTTFTWIVVGSLLCGYIRAASVVNQNLTVSEYCSESSLPAALGLNMVAKGVFVLSAGQFLGKYFYISLQQIAAITILYLIIPNRNEDNNKQSNIFLGWLRDYTHSFSLCIHYQNIILISVAISWTLEIGIRSRFNTK